MLDKLRQLDAEVAEKVMGLIIEHANKAWSAEDWLGSDTPTEQDTCAIVNSDWKPGALFPQYAVIPYYSTDIAAACLVESEIERRNLWNEYVIELCIELKLDGDHRDAGMSLHRMFWTYLRATPEQRCRSALRAVEYFLSTINR